MFRQSRTIPLRSVAAPANIGGEAPVQRGQVAHA
jgi:hypothetical protein